MHSKLLIKLSVITAGFKMEDVDVINPLTGKPMCIDGIYKNVQSCDHVFPLNYTWQKKLKIAMKHSVTFYHLFFRH